MPEPGKRCNSRALLFHHPRLRRTLLLLSFSYCFNLNAQDNLEDRLIRETGVVATDSGRIMALGQLSDYYYASKQFSKGDSVIEKLIMLAEQTLNQNLVLFAYFGNVGYRSTGTSTKDRSKNTIVYINRALAYAKTAALRDYMALAYSNLGVLYNTDGNTEEAFRNANLGFTTALGTENDSVKVVCAVQLGNVYLHQSDILTAFKTYTTALNIALHQEEKLLLPIVYHAMAALYKKLGNYERAKNYVYRSLLLNQEWNNHSGQVSDYIMLAKLSNYIAAKDYLQQAISLADSIHHTSQKNEAQKILFSYMLLQEKPSYVIAYLESQPELKNIFQNTGPDYLDWMMAEIYLYGGIPDSAIHYFRKAETSFNLGYDLTSKKNFFGEYAMCLQQLNNIPAAIAYYERSVELCKEASDLLNLKAYTRELKNLYYEKGDYRQAFEYSTLYDHYKDTVDMLSREKDLALMEIENVARQQQRDEELAQEELRREYNLQYMLITIIVATVFVLMIMIGAFKVSTFTIRLMGFFSLIFLFEFIILFLDKWIHGITHGEPWKSWLIKIGIISILLPVHHYMEHKLIHYLLSRHLITVRSRISMSRFFRKNKKPLPPKLEKEVPVTKVVDPRQSVQEAGGGQMVPKPK